jgi:hypothetical protein
MERSNYTADLQARGLPAPAGFNKLWDESAGFGGPIRRDRLWFFLAHRYRGNDLIGNMFYEQNPNDFVYHPDLSRPLQAGGWDLDDQVRLTAQLTPRNKISGVYDRANKCNCPTTNVTPLQTGESALQLTYPEVYLVSLSWQSTISPKLLWDAAVSHSYQDDVMVPQPDSGVTATAPYSVVELTTGQRLHAPLTATGEQDDQNYVRGALSYVTGSHAAKVGFTFHNGWRNSITNAYSDATQLNLFNGIPQSITLSTAPYVSRFNIDDDLGIYGQDKWTLRRLTLTGGLRFDYYHAEVPAQAAPAATWIGARSFAAVPDVPNWKDISPRVGVSYDLFGTGKTAIKASVSRYVTAQMYGFTDSISPFNTTVNSATRTWNDANHDFVPQGDPLNPLPNGEFLGTIDPNFGKSIITTRYDPAVSQGWGRRPYNWEYSASVQHELMARVSVEAAYFRRTFGNQTVTDNLNLTPADFDPFCITAPTNPQLGSVSGSQICGLYDIKPAYAGLLTSNQVITFAKNFPGETSQTYNGVDFNVNARPTGRLFLQAGVSTGRTVTKNCALVNNPMSLRFCEVAPPFLGSYRVSGGYTFPWQLQASVVFQSIPPDPFNPQSGGNNTIISLANYPVTNAVAGASLGRPIATPGSVITIPLLSMSNYTDYVDRVNQLDLRITKGVRIGRYRLEAIADFYNVFNANSVLTFNTTYGPAWLTPVTILQSSFIRLGGRFTF